MIRQSANALPMQLAEDTAAVLSNGQTVDKLPLGQSVDVAKSLAPFVIVYNDQAQPIAGTGRLDGATPKIPSGVLQYAEQQGHNKVTWQPQPNVRLATVTVPWRSSTAHGWVTGGQSLREVEKQASMLSTVVAMTWLLAIILVGTIMFVLPDWSTKSKKKKK